MTVVAEKTGTLASLVDDIATTLLAHAEWTDADTAVTNSGATAANIDNGRVLHHSPTDTYHFFWVSEGAFRNEYNDRYQTGIAFCMSAGWDATNHYPTVASTARSGSDFYNSMPTEARIENSYTYEYSQGNPGHEGLWVVNNAPFTGPIEARDLETIYFLSGRPDGLTVGAWNLTDGNYGRAAYINIEQVANKFWTDGATPICFCGQSGGKNLDVYLYYGFNNYYSQGLAPTGVVAKNVSGFDESDWGHLNPDPDEDTFFFRRALMYSDSGKIQPVAFFEDVLPNMTDTGLSHGDTVTHNGVTYRCLKQYGGGQTYPELTTALIRYD